MSKLQSKKRKIILIGAGISGLSCLYHVLRENGKKISHVEIYEKNHIGGVLQNIQKDGYILEHGAQGVLANRENFIHLVKELNLSTHEQTTSKRYLFFKNQIILLSPKNLLNIFTSGLLSPISMLRVFSELFQKTGGSHNQNETVEKFFKRRFGKKFTQNFVNPLMKGIWGGGAGTVLARFAFPNLTQIEQTESILKYFFKKRFFLDKSAVTSQTNSKINRSLLNFNDGMQTLPYALLNQIKEICKLHKIEFSVQKKEFILRTIENDYDIILHSGQPWKQPHFLPESLTQSLPQLKSACEVLNQIKTHTLVVVGIGSHNNDVQFKPKLDGFGALAVENNPEGVLGVICVHSVNPQHVPENSFLYRIMIGGENFPEHLNLNTSLDNDIVQLAKNFLHKYKILDKNKVYQFEHVIRHFNYIPLPTAQQDDVLKAVQEIEKNLHGFFIVGNYILGPAIDKCLTLSRQTANKISNYLS